jgi:hypothetical protein
VMFTFGMTPQAATIAEPRFLGAISVIASLHLMMLVTSGNELSWHTIALAILQLSLIIFVVHLRSTEIWQLAAIVAFAVSAVVFRRQLWRRALLVVMLSIIGAVSLGIYKQIFYHPRYFKDEIPTRVVWHSALMGLTINPALRDKYGIVPLDDVSITEAVRQDMIRRKQDTAVASLFPRENYSVGNFYQFNWAMYEVEAETMFWRVLTEDFLEVLRTYTVFAPRMIWDDISYLSNMSDDGKNLFARDVLENVAPAVRREQGLYFSLFRLLPLLASLAAIVTLLISRCRDDRAPLAALALLSVVSILPPILATPAIQYIQPTLLLGAALLYFTATSYAVTMIRAALPQKKQYVTN